MLGLTKCFLNGGTGAKQSMALGWFWKTRCMDVHMGGWYVSMSQYKEHLSEYLMNKIVC